jgi:hypothetical protein
MKVHLGENTKRRIKHWRYDLSFLHIPALSDWINVCLSRFTFTFRIHQRTCRQIKLEGSGMKLSHILLSTLLFCAVCPAQQSIITIRLLNGKNGKPITDRDFNIWLGNSNNLLRDTDLRGEIKMDVTDVNPRKIRVLPDFRFDCRSKQDFGEGRLIEYSLEEILTKGVVGNNLCGKATSLPQPSVLIIFARPRTFIEKWKL